MPDFTSGFHLWLTEPRAKRFQTLLVLKVRDPLLHVIAAAVVRADWHLLAHPNERIAHQLNQHWMVGLIFRIPHRQVV